jgi:hypothetical protein
LGIREILFPKPSEPSKIRFWPVWPVFCNKKPSTKTPVCSMLFSRLQKREIKIGCGLWIFFVFHRPNRPNRPNRIEVIMLLVFSRQPPKKPAPEVLAIVVYGSNFDEVIKALSPLGWSLVHKIQVQ